MCAFGNSVRILRKWRWPMLPRLMQRTRGDAAAWSVEVGPEDGFIVLLVPAQGEANDLFHLVGLDGALGPGALGGQHAWLDGRAGIEHGSRAHRALADQRAIGHFRGDRTLDSVAQARAGVAHGGDEG